MSDKTAIEWADATWNPLVGCTKVSPGCDNCYAQGQVNRRHAAAISPKTSAKMLEAFPAPFDTVSIRPDRFLTQPLRWKLPRRIFVNSLSDLLHMNIPDTFIARVFAVMALAPQHTFQLLTKRHGRMRTLLNDQRFLTLVDDARVDISPGCGDFTWPLPNLWLGVSVEDQQRADLRIPPLTYTPAAVRWISAEPLLGPVDLTRWLRDEDDTRILDWVVVGGESGRGARPMHPDWATSLRDQCGVLGVPFLLKQWGDWRHCAEAADYPLEQAMRAAGTYQQWERYPVYDVAPDGSYDLNRIPTPGISAPMQRVGKKLAGRHLDGRTHNQYPET